MASAVSMNAALPESPALAKLSKADPSGVFKLLTRTLPVMTELKRRHPAQFKSNMCPLCDNKVEECYKHMLIQCPEHETARNAMLASASDWMALLETKEETFPPSASLSDTDVKRELSKLDPQEHYVTPSDEGASPLFERRQTKYEGDSTVIRINTTAFPSLWRADGVPLITTVRESRFWQLLAQHSELKQRIPATLPFITCLVDSLRGYREGQETTRPNLHVERDMNYWACRQSLLRIFVSELGIDTELFCMFTAE